MTRQEVYEFFDMQIRYVCIRVGAPWFGITDHQELLQGIQRANREVFQHLNAFIEAYSAWFEFTDKIIREGRGGMMNPAEMEKFLAVGREKEATRERLKDLLARFPQS